jgi:hypothetical protein
MLPKLHTKINTTCPDKLTDGTIPLHDNACPQVAHRVKYQLNAMWWEVLKRPA